MAVEFLSKAKQPVYMDHEQIMEAAERAETRACWDFNCSLGDTIGEKFEALYIKLVEVTQVLISKGAEGYFWIVTSPEVTAMFESAHRCLVQTEDQIKMGSDDIRHVGLLNRRWQIYSDPKIGSNNVLIGIGEDSLGSERYGFLKIANFII